LGACAALFTRPMVVFGHGLGHGRCGPRWAHRGVVGGHILNAIAQAPVAVERTVPAQWWLSGW